MKRPRRTKQLTTKHFLFAIAAGTVLLAVLGAVLWFSRASDDSGDPYGYVRTIAGIQGEFGEPFGIAVKGDEIFVSDGQNGRIWRISGGTPSVFVEGLDTPSAIAFDKAGDLIVVDSGSHTIKSINAKGEIRLLAGVEGRSGFADGDAASALFNAPIGVAVTPDGKIVVADTYNDRIRVIENERVSTLAGNSNGYADGYGEHTKFDTPCGLSIWHDKLLIADTGNHRLRIVEADGRVWTLAGNGDSGLTDGLLPLASFAQPTAVAVDRNGSIFVADGNSIRQIGATAMTVVRTISDEGRGIKDGPALRSRFNRPSGLTINASGNLLVADSENRLARKFGVDSSGHEITAAEIVEMRDKPEGFRTQQSPRWPFDPPQAKRDIAGTLGEIRGEMTDRGDQVWFHNGLDIAGSYGETARFVRDEKVLRPVATENFGTLREFIRMPTLGYIHIRLGRSESSVPFGDEHFQFERDPLGKIVGVRVARGAKFKAGEPIGTLNSMNHVHLIAGRSGSEMNALDALVLPGLTDSRAPTIEKVTLFDESWREIETTSPNSRIKLTGKTRVVVRAFDQADGNSERRRLGLYRLAYKLIKQGEAESETKWTITFDRLPAPQSISLVYANGSHSGATGETIFNYIVTNFVDGDEFHEDFLDAATLENGIYTLRVFAADYFGNITTKDINIEVLK